MWLSNDKLSGMCPEVCFYKCMATLCKVYGGTDFKVALEMDAARIKLRGHCTRSN